MLYSIVESKKASTSKMQIVELREGGNAVKGRAKAFQIFKIVLKTSCHR